MIESIPDELEVYVPDFKYLLYDLSHYSHQDIKGEGELRVFLEILSFFFRDDFEERFKEALVVLEKLRKQEKGIEYFETVIRYVINAKEGIGVNDLKNIVNNISTERGETIMTIAEQLRKEGKKEGKREGKKEGKSETAKNMLDMGMNIEDIAKATKLEEDKIKEIKQNSHH